MCDNNEPKTWLSKNRCKICDIEYELRHENIHRPDICIYCNKEIDEALAEFPEEDEENG